jgi:hypothetical protein
MQEGIDMQDIAKKLFMAGIVLCGVSHNLEGVVQADGDGRMVVYDFLDNNQNENVKQIIKLSGLLEQMDPKQNDLQIVADNLEKARREFEGSIDKTKLEGAHQELLTKVSARARKALDAFDKHKNGGFLNAAQAAAPRMKTVQDATSTVVGAVATAGMVGVSVLGAFSKLAFNTGQQVWQSHQDTGALRAQVTNKQSASLAAAVEARDKQEIAEGWDEDEQAEQAAAQNQNTISYRLKTNRKPTYYGYKQGVVTFVNPIYINAGSSALFVLIDVDVLSESGKKDRAPARINSEIIDGEQFD